MPKRVFFPGLNKYRLCRWTCNGQTLLQLPTAFNLIAYLNMSMPTGRYFVSNGGMPLVPGQIGKGLIVPINPMSHVAVRSLYIHSDSR